MLLFLIVSISVANAYIIVDSNVQNSSAALQVDCGGKFCKNGATCNKTGNYCDCPKGTEGDACEVVTECAELKEICDEINTECIYDPYSKGATCKCNDEKKKFNFDDACADCYCGDFQTRCELFFERKTCFCKEGYAVKLGMCTDCTCGEFTKSCRFYEAEKSCTCKSGYQLKSGVCTRCSCGEHTTLCLFIGENKSCNCDAGYSFKSGTCAECSCGAHTMMCSFTGEDKQCVCDEGYSFASGKCVECNCGKNSTNCFYNKEEKYCTCKDGNANKLGTCTSCVCGPDESCSFTSSGEKDCLCIGKLCREHDDSSPPNPFLIIGITVGCGVFIFGVAFVAYLKLRKV